jgi:hypothetical protein
LKFAELNLLEVYVAPISALMIAAWLITIALRWITARFQPLRHVWHPALFAFAVYIIVLSSTVLIIAQ